MVAEVIKKHNFQKTLKRLKDFSERKKEEIEIESVATYDYGFFLIRIIKLLGENLIVELKIFKIYLLD